MIGHGQKLTRKQESAIAGLIAQPTIAAAAASAGVSEATLGRWLADPTFAEAYKVARRLVVGQAIGAVQTAATDAVEVLREIMGDKLAPVPSRVTAARAVLDTAFKAVELEDLADRIDRLEELSTATTEGRDA